MPMLDHDPYARIPNLAAQAQLQLQQQGQVPAANVPSLAYREDPGNIRDGFTLVPSLLPYPTSMDWLNLHGMALIRRANIMWHFDYCLPEDEVEFIAPYDTYERRIDVEPGAFLWGMRYIEYDASFNEVAPNGGQVRITEGCTGVPLQADFTNSSAYAVQRFVPTQYAIGSPYTRGALPYVLLTEPRPIVSPGSMFVEIANRKTDGTNLRCQLILTFSYPCIKIDDMVRGSEMGTASMNGASGASGASGGGR